MSRERYQKKHFTVRCSRNFRNCVWLEEEDSREFNKLNQRQKCVPESRLKLSRGAITEENNANNNRRAVKWCWVSEALCQHCVTRLIFKSIFEFLFISEFLRITPHTNRNLINKCISVKILGLFARSRPLVWARQWPRMTHRANFRKRLFRARFWEHLHWNCTYRLWQRLCSWHP